ncbi:hypothetical protein BC939DRAFT_22544 [Gamsiella multidivaricata]|uniref:uncharacterized protein n=1 Tax=Gamsiella multidivaricata TaxID=101098 RepID=UPI002220DACA|nr:uncharacterized protein BC939DRAFT_22544 [Gamsiella multidivaricata]KAI7816902.1 hypothetical protein BC939DRAFT_22544 [Gamsiella multidivaricata]
MILRPHGSTNTMPETFELDHYRMLSFHNDFQDLTILCTLLILFRQLAHNCWTTQDLIEIKKVVWLLLTDENANFGANTNPGPGATAAAGKVDADAASGSSSGMKDIVVQIEFAARKVRERSKNGSAVAGSSTVTASGSLGVGALNAGQRPSPASETLTPKPDPRGVEASGSRSGDVKENTAPTAAPTVPANGLSASDTNLLTAWLDNALSRTSTLYMLIQKRLLIHFRRWLYLHSSSSMMVLSASCASLASAMSMSSSSSSPEDSGKADEDEEGDESCGATAGAAAAAAALAVRSNDSTATSKEKAEQGQDQDRQNGNGNGPSDRTEATATLAAPAPAPAPAPSPASPPMSPEEANKAAAEALAAKLSFNTAEMEAHGLTGLEDEMVALLEKIRSVSEFNKKVYGLWYCEMIKQGRAENWLEKDRDTVDAL